MKLNRRKALIYGIPLFFVLVLTLFLVFIFATDSPIKNPPIFSRTIPGPLPGKGGGFWHFEWVDLEHFVTLDTYDVNNFTLSSMDKAGKETSKVKFGMPGGFDMNGIEVPSPGVSPDKKWALFTGANQIAIVSLDGAKSYHTKKKIKAPIVFSPLSTVDSVA